MKRFAPLLSVALAAGFGAWPGVAQTVPSAQQQQAACMGDAFRLCSQAIPDKERIIQCMSAQHASLSPGCRAVFDASKRDYVARRRTPRVSLQD